MREVWRDDKGGKEGRKKGERGKEQELREERGKG